MQSRTRNQAMFTMSTVMYLFSVCQALPLQPTDKLVRVTLLESISDARGRREANDNLPDHLTFGIPLHDKDVVLRLTRTSLLRAVTSDRPSTEDASEDLGNAAVYTDTSLGSALIIKMEEGDYKLKGSLLHANQGWTVEPHKSYGNQSELGAAMHRISPMRIDDNISFIGDNVIDTTAQERRNQGASLEGHPPARGQHRRHRRAFVAHVIEVAMIVDYNDFAKWQKEVGDAKAIPEMRLWYTYVAESMIQENNGGMDSLCGGMFCSIQNSTSSSCLTMVPQEFTPCSTDMWCVAGECLHKTRENATRNATSALPATEMSKTSGSTTFILTTPTATNATLVPMTMSSTTTKSSTNASQATIETTNPTATMTSPASTSPTTASGTSTQLEPTKVTLDEATSMKPSPRTITASGTSTQPTKVTLDEATSMNPSPRTTTAPTAERWDILTSTTPPPNSSIPMNSDRNKTSDVNTFRQCLAPLYRKNLAEFWDCLVNLASDILHELVGIKLV